MPNGPFGNQTGCAAVLAVICLIAVIVAGGVLLAVFAR